MNNNWLRKIKKGVALSLILGSTSISTMVQLSAYETQEPQMSPWSIGTLNEGEKYGIYPMSWYSGNFKESISQDKLRVLLENVGQKLSELELERDAFFTPIGYEKDGTRGSVVIGLYNSLAAYKLPEELEKSKGNAAEYLQKRKILNGTNKGLELDKPCTVEQAAVLASRVIEDTYKVAEAGAKGFMWQVSKGENTLYLLGSIHIGETDLYPLHPVVKEAFEKSDKLIVEADILGAEEDMEAFTKASRYTDGTSLQDHISEETYEKCLEVFGQYGLPLDLYKQFKPWGISNNLQVLTSSKAHSLEEGAEATNLGIDKYFLTRAKLAGKPVGELEGLLYQADLFNSMSPEIHEKHLNDILDDILDISPKEPSDPGQTLKMWLKQWYRADIDGFESTYAAIVEAEKSEYKQVLFGKRDQNMADKLAALLEKDDGATYFVVVGAGHLVMEEAVIDLLKSQGYAVERFWK